MPQLVTTVGRDFRAFEEPALWLTFIKAAAEDPSLPLT